MYVFGVSCNGGKRNTIHLSSILDKQSPPQETVSLEQKSFAGAIHLCDGLPDRWAFECKQSGTMQGGEQRVQEYLGSNSLVISELCFRTQNADMLLIFDCFLLGRKARHSVSIHRLLSYMFYMYIIIAIFNNYSLIVRHGFLRHCHLAALVHIWSLPVITAL